VKIDLYLYRKRGALGVATHCSKFFKPFEGFECFGVAEICRGKQGEWVVVDTNCASVATPLSLDWIGGNLT
jgi:hypothetical protein